MIDLQDRPNWQKLSSGENQTLQNTVCAITTTTMVYPIIIAITIVAPVVLSAIMMTNVTTIPVNKEKA